MAAFHNGLRSKVAIYEVWKSTSQIAKLRPDFKEGRPKKFTKKQIDHALGLLETQSYKEVEETTGISKSTLIRAKKKVMNKQ